MELISITLVGGALSLHEIKGAVGAHADDYSQEPLPPVSFPHKSHSQTTPIPVFPEDPPRTAVRSDPNSYGVSALPWDPVHMKSCVHAFQE